ncbi:hypothetical protein BU14_0177s0012 [Porphyra umbilicalis]|uniref:Golgi pH regulator conserved domain-containing protein n=1 Tax=Porphyra umbilicalis TaxID=2786 RepID=A0A1X6P763_PORUM|nr:hypothetical protein BU14_0177s0012 [Porphyra umbilicalis]|eukprot:OSX76732.1 hypothetical protein BU14_0177s0012 [Porphyra umbilicalis]
MVLSGPLAMAASDAVISVAAFSASFRLGTVFYSRFLCRESEPRHAAVRHLFALTFALSVSLIELILFDVASVMHSATRRMHWNASCAVLLLLCCVILPFAQAYYISVDAHISRPDSARVAFVSTGLFVYAFYRVGDPLPPAAVRPLSTLSTLSAASVSAPLRSRLTLSAVAGLGAELLSPTRMAGVMSRLLVIGTAMLAVLSGVTAVSLPHAYLAAVLRPPVPRDVLAARRRRMLAAYDEVRTVQRAEALARHAAAWAAPPPAGGGGGGGRAAPPAAALASAQSSPSVGGGRGAFLPPRLGAGVPPRVAVSPYAAAAPATAPGVLPWSPPSPTTAAAAAASPNAYAAASSARASARARDAFLAYDAAASVAAEQVAARTRVGRCATAVGVAMALLCAARVGIAIANVGGGLVRRLAPRVGGVLGPGVRAAAGGGWAGGGGGASSVRALWARRGGSPWVAAARRRAACTAPWRSRASTRRAVRSGSM